MQSKNIVGLMSTINIAKTVYFYVLSPSENCKNPCKLVKVRRFKKRIVEPKFLPKNKWADLFFYPDGPEILETWNRNSSFKYFQTIRIEKQILSLVFWEKYASTILFWDLLTFTSSILVFNKCLFLFNIIEYC